MAARFAAAAFSPTPPAISGELPVVEDSPRSATRVHDSRCSDHPGIDLAYRCSRSLQPVASAAYYQLELSPIMFAMEFQRIGDLPVLVALPMFTFAGILVAESRHPPQRLGSISPVQPSAGYPAGSPSWACWMVFSLTAFTGASGHYRSVAWAV